MCPNGYIYILENIAFPHLLKIGMTQKKPEDRARELSTTGVPYSYKVAYACEVYNCRAAENVVHHRLEKFRSSQEREFFEIKVELAIDIVNDVAKEINQLYRQEKIVLKNTENKDKTKLERTLVYTHRDYKIYSPPKIVRIKEEEIEDNSLSELEKKVKECETKAIKELKERMGPWLKKRKDKLQVRDGIIRKYTEEYIEIIKEYNPHENVMDIEEKAKEWSDKYLK